MIEKMLSFTDDMHEETKYSELDYNREDTAAYFENVIRANQFVHINDGCLMIGVICKTFFGDSLIADDVLLYVKKEYRCKGLAEEAVKSFVKWADDNGAKRVSLGQSTGVCGEEFKAVAKSCGFKKLGEVFAR